MASAELKAVVEMLRTNNPLAGDTIMEQRAAMVAATGNLPRPDDVGYERVKANGVPSEWVTAPESSDDRVVVYFHGGAYVMGSIDSHRGLCTRLARAAGARVLSVDYRLAPEHAFPAAVDDAVAAWRHVLEAGVAPERCAFAGDSAGGGLTAAALIAVRDAGLPLPAAAACISPWLDLTLSAGTLKTKLDEDPLVTVDNLLRPAAEAYLAGADAKTPTASPIFAELAGLPALLVQVGTAEILLDDARSFAERAKAAGVEVELEVAQDMFHVWHAFADILPEGGEAIERIATFFRKHW